MNKKVFLISTLLALLPVMMTVYAQTSYKIRVPHEIEFECVEGTGGYDGYWGVRVIWGAYPEAGGYQIISHHGAYGGGTVPGDTHVWPIGGGSPVAPGACPAIEAGVNPAWFQDIYEVWGTFPEGGNLELTKTDNVYGAAHPGDEVTYFLLYKNTGRYPLYDCIVTECWPSYMEYVAGGAYGGGNSVTWMFGTLNPGHWQLVELVLRISEDLPRGINEIYNVAVVHPAPSPTPVPSATPPTGITSLHGYAVSHCDALRCNFATGDTEWIDKPLGTAFEDIIPYVVVRGSDEVRLLSGMASFNHTVPTGVLLLYQGGFRLTNCPDLPDNVLSEITLTTPASLDHCISGIMAADEYVKVTGEFLTVEVYNGHYEFTGETGRETVSVRSGGIIVVDPHGDRHELHAGDDFTWPTVISKRSKKSDGPRLIGTDPQDFSSLAKGDYTINYEFDQPVINISTDSVFALGETEGIWQGYGTFDQLSSYLTVSWNADNTIMTLSLPNIASWLGFDLSAGTTLIAAVHLKNVQGASGTTPDIILPLTLYLNVPTSSLGWVNCEYEYFAFITQGNDLLSPNSPWTFRQLPELPGELPEGLFPAGPAYEFNLEGSIVSHYWLQLKPSLRYGLPPGGNCGGIYSWNGTQWELQHQGFGIGWTWTDPLTDPHQILVLASTQTRPDIPEVISVSPSVKDGPVSKNSPIQIQLKAPSGIRGEFADIRINGQRTLSYEPSTGTLVGWDLTEQTGVVTLTYTPASDWQPGALVYVSYNLPAGFGLIPADGDFAFLVAYNDTSDSDGDGMVDDWENANGTNASQNDKDADPDGDTYSNITEFLFCSNPVSSASLPAFPSMDLMSNQESFFDGNDMELRCRVTNGPVQLPVDMYVVLELLGGYYFWPTFSQYPTPLSFTMPPNIDISFDLLSMKWDEIPDVMMLTWYGAFLDSNTQQLYCLDTLSILLDQ